MAGGMPTRQYAWACFAAHAHAIYEQVSVKSKAEGKRDFSSHLFGVAATDAPHNWIRLGLIQNDGIPRTPWRGTRSEI
jgi:hypothetical protein